jgi:outer membrane protein TolC
LEDVVLRKTLGLLSVIAFIAAAPVRGMENEPPLFPDLSAIEDLDLETAQRMALASNPTMGVAVARVEQARARVRQAVAAWWPSVDVSASGGRTRLSKNSWELNKALAQISGRDMDRTTRDYAAELQASWVLFDGFYRTFNERQARYGEKSADASRTDAQRLLVAAVAEAFFNAQLAQANVGIAEADSEFYSQQLRDARNRYEVGAGPWGDVLNIQVQINSAQTAVLLARRELEAACYGLAALLGIPDAAFPPHVRLKPLDREVEVMEEGDRPDRLIEEALAQRPDIAELELIVKQAEAAVGKAEALFYPTLALTGAASGINQGDDRLTDEDFSSAVFLNLSWNLFAGGEDRARRFEAEQVRREANYALLNLRNTIASEVRQDLTMLEAAREQVVLQRESVRLVEENRELARNEYEEGEAPLVRLNEAQRDLTATYGRLVLALAGYYSARERLLAATGRNLVMAAEGAADWQTPD